jgi:hypothetical protein
MEEQLAWAADKPGQEGELLSLQSDTEAYHGRVSRARDLSRRAFDAAGRTDDREEASMWRAYTARREAEVGDIDSARKGIAGALALFRGQNVEVPAALALARIGDAPKAMALVEELEKRYPSDTLLRLFIASDCGFGKCRPLRTNSRRKPGTSI